MKCFKLIILSFVILTFSCTKDEDVSTIDYSSGVFVVNEGPFGNGTGTITFHSGQDTIQDVFGRENSGKALGNIVQSMIKFGDKYFISINNGAKIQVVNAKDFKSIGEIGGINVPRYFVADQNKLYISNWGADFNSGAVYEINPETMTLSNPISIGGAPENMIIKNDKLYVAVSTSSAQNNSNKVVVIDTKTNLIINTIVVGDSPEAIILDKNNDLWVICNGLTDWTNPAQNTNGSLYKIKNDQVVASFIISNGANGLVADKNGDRLYFLMGDRVMAHDITDQVFENESVYDGLYYGIGYHKSKGRIYLADAGDYQSNGRAIFIDPTAKTSGRFTTGIVPGYFYVSE
jgi:YVTN family beta-propeller protein